MITQNAPTNTFLTLIEELNKRKHSTAYTEGEEPGYTHVVLTEPELSYIQNLKNLGDWYNSEEYKGKNYWSIEGSNFQHIEHLTGINLFSVERNKTLNFYHVTTRKALQSIQLNGLNAGTNRENNLGTGVYVVDATSDEGVYNLLEYLYEIRYTALYAEELAVIRGNYTGTYTECISGGLHEGFICIPVQQTMQPITLTSHEEIDGTTAQTLLIVK